MKRLLISTLAVIFASIAMWGAGRAYIRHRPEVFNASRFWHAYCIGEGCCFLGAYAEEHDGHFPFHTNGYADAILSMTNAEGCTAFSGPGFDPHVYDAVTRPIADMDERLVGRVYVQGLTGDNNPDIVILYDKRPSAGGDHCHLPQKLWAPLAREYATIGGERRRILESEWPAFITNQLGLLLKDGFSAVEARRMLALDDNQ